MERGLFEEGNRNYLPWSRFNYPVHCYYDILIALDLMTQLSYADDKRLKPALKILSDKRQSNGTWLLDKVHPVLGPGAGYDLDVRKVRPFALEKPGKSSKWSTLAALRFEKS
jgi:hypothetical protein